MAQLRLDYEKFLAEDAEVIVVGPENAASFAAYFTNGVLTDTGTRRFTAFECATKVPSIRRHAIQQRLQSTDTIHGQITSHPPRITPIRARLLPSVRLTTTRQ